MKSLSHKKRIADRLLKDLLQATDKESSRKEDLDYIRKYELFEQLVEEIKAEIRSKFICFYKNHNHD